MAGGKEAKMAKEEGFPMIELKNLTKRYGDLVAVDHLNLTIQKGEIFGLLGPNGAGKSTTILMLLGLSEPDEGEAIIKGFNATRHPIQSKKIIGYLPDNVGFYKNMTGLENLVYVARLNGLSPHTAHEEALRLLERVGLMEAVHKKTSTYSRGMIQRLGLADVLIKNPEIIILDEPTLGIDPKGIKDFLNLIVRLSREEQITVLLSSHLLHQVQKICDRVGLFVKGKLIAQGNLNSLVNELFPGDPFTVELKLNNDPQRIQQFTEKLLKIDAIHEIKTEGQMLKINCTEDLTSDIAQRAVEDGLQLISLTKKEYGLEEIYERYFENEAVL